MASLTRAAPEEIAPPGRQRTVFRGATIWRWTVIIVAAVYFLLPLWAALRFAGISAFGSVISEPGFTSSLALSVRLAVINTLITIALMLPTTVYVHLRLQKLRRLMEGSRSCRSSSPRWCLSWACSPSHRASSRARRGCLRWPTWCWPCRSPTAPSTPGCARPT